MKIVSSAIVLSLISISGFARCDFQQSGPIKVMIDGKPVSFTITGPKEVSGRVLIPMRGVLEQLGAYVGWDPASQTVTASRGDLDVVLQIGSTTATVNKKPVTLDVPATILNGTTLVPLRFLSESLGAKVVWLEASNTVAITTTHAAVVPPVRRVPVDRIVRSANIRSLEVVNPDGSTSNVFRGGSKLHVDFQGARGAQASYQILGLTNPLPMRETSPGLYEADYVLPAASSNGQVLPQAIAIVQLQTPDQTRTGESLPFTVDTFSPRLDYPLPEPNSAVISPRPIIALSLDDGPGPGIDSSSTTIEVDGRDVTLGAKIDGYEVSFVPDQNLRTGTHRVDITAKDLAGNYNRKSWNFRILPPPPYPENLNCRPTGGGNLQFEVVAKPGSVVILNASRLNHLPMKEVQPGHYRASYRPAPGGLGLGSVFSASVRAGGVSLNLQLKNALPSDQQAPPPPMIRSIREAGRIAEGTSISGSAAPFSRVTLSLVSAAHNGATVAQVAVDADRNGNFQSPPLRHLGPTGRPVELHVKCAKRDGHPSSEVVLHLKT